MYTIDKIEIDSYNERIATVECPDGFVLNISLDFFNAPKNTKEGDKFYISNNEIKIDYHETNISRNKNALLKNKVFKNC